MKRPLRFVIGAVSALLLSCLILGAAYMAGMLAGGHMYAFELPIKLTAPFAVLVGVLATICPMPRDSKRSSLVALAAGMALGLVYWYLSKRLFALHFTGLWQGGFLLLDYDLQAIFCWVMAGASAMLIAVVRRPLITVSTAAALSVLAAVLPSPLFNYLTNNQELTVAFATPRSLDASTTSSLRVIIPGAKEFDTEEVAAHVMHVLRASGLQGEFRITNLYRIGTGKKGLQIIVVNSRVDGRSLLPQPDGIDLIYAQTSEGWQKIPPTAGTLSRSVEIWGPGTHKDSLAYFGIADASGVSIMGRIDSN